MKKVSMLLLLVILASVLLMAAAPLRLARLHVINKSSHVIYMQLTGKTSDEFYYLTIPKGTKSLPEESSYTIVEDIYDRTTWYGPGDLECEGVKSTGTFWAIKGVLKIVFTPCGQVNWIHQVWWLCYDVDGVAGCQWDPNNNGIWDVGEDIFAGIATRRAKINWGEPKWGEKVTYFKYLDAWRINLLWRPGCFWSVGTKTFKSPRAGCYWVYKY
jgi:hypothetical protein